MEFVPYFLLDTVDNFRFLIIRFFTRFSILVNVPLCHIWCKMQPLFSSNDENVASAVHMFDTAIGTISGTKAITNENRGSGKILAEDN